MNFPGRFIIIKFNLFYLLQKRIINIYFIVIYFHLVKKFFKNKSYFKLLYVNVSLKFINLFVLPIDSQKQRVIIINFNLKIC